MAGKIIRYKVVKQRALNKLEEEVLHLLDAGWEPIGGMAVLSTLQPYMAQPLIHYTQTMIFRAEEQML